MCGKAPSYLKDLLVPDNKDRNMYLNALSLLVCPRSDSVWYGERAFAHAAPTLWKSLPLHIRQSETIYSFKTNAKTYSFT